MEPLLNSLTNSNTYLSIVLQFFIMVAVSFIPFAPIPLLATIIGTNHSFFIGLCINLGGTVIGSIILYWLSKNILRRHAQKIVNKYQYLEKFLTLIVTNGFLAVLIGRLVPIIPSAGVNLIAGISGVNFIAFATATLFGKLPIMIAFSLAGNQLAAGNWQTLIMIALYLLILLLVGRKLKAKWQAS